MNILNSLVLLLLGVVSADRFDDTSDQQLALYSPSENESALELGLPDSGLYGPDSEAGDLSDDLTYLDETSEGSDEYEIQKSNRLSCPFSGKGCRFKKAKCVCRSKGATFNFTIKKFKMVDESPEDGSGQDGSGEPPYTVEYPDETNDLQVYPVESNGQAYPEGGEVNYPGEGSVYPNEEDAQAHLVETELQIPAEVAREPSTEEIMRELPTVIEGFKAVENIDDPRQIMAGDSDGNQGFPSGPDSNAFDDKTVRIKTEDVDDNKVHEYEYLRIKNVDKDGVEEKHIETPDHKSPQFSYHKGLIRDMDNSIKKKLIDSLSSAPPNTVTTIVPVQTNGVAVAVPQSQPATLYPYAQRVQNKLDEVNRRNDELLSQGLARAPISMGYYPPPTAVPAVNTDVEDKLEEKLEKKLSSADKIQKKLDEVKKRNDELLSQGLARPPIGMGYYPGANGLPEVNTEVEDKLEEKLEKKLSSADKIQKKLDEVKKRNDELLSQGLARPPISMGYYTAPTGVPMAPAFVQGQPITIPSSMAIPLPYSPIFPTDGTLVAQSAPVISQGASLRGLKKSKKSKKSKKNKKQKKKNKKSKCKKTREEKNEEKMRKKMEKNKRREERKKAKIAKKNAEKREREVLEELKEKERIIEEQLEKEKEEMEESQIAASQKARLAKKLQRQQYLQQRKIDQAEKNIVLKHQRQRQIEERKRLQRIRKEQELLKQQEKELDDLSGLGDEDADNRLQPRNTVDDDDDD